jgi:hypothetical protein
MVGKMGRMPLKHEVTPCNAMNSEWDVLAQIWETLEELNGRANIAVSHVKGHQDKHKHCALLDLAGQLNVDADELANTHLTEHPDKDCSTVPMLPANGIQLHLPEGTVTHHMKRELRNARTKDALVDLILARTGWTERTFDEVDWEAHWMAMNRHSRSGVTLIKHMHDGLPVGHKQG